MIVYVVIGVLTVAIIVLLIIIVRLIASGSNDSYLQQDILTLRQEVADLNVNLNQTLTERMDKTQTSMQAQLRNSMALVNDVSRRLTKLDETNRRVVDVADELKTLQNVLQNPKQRGVFGELYLNSVLENVMSPNQWQSQYRFNDGEVVDAVIFLDKNKILPIDSKFSLENYNRYIEENDKEIKAKLLAKVRIDLKNRIDETSKYIRPNENTMDFAFMFIPNESLYYDLLTNSVGQGSTARDLIEYAFVDKRVIITSPTSFMAYLETVLQGLRSLQIEQQAKDIQKRVVQLGAHIKKYDEYMSKLGNSLGTTVGHFNNAYKEFAKVDKDIIKIAADDSMARILPEQLDKPNPSNND